MSETYFHLSLFLFDLAWFVHSVHTNMVFVLMNLARKWNQKKNRRHELECFFFKKRGDEKDAEGKIKIDDIL